MSMRRYLWIFFATIVVIFPFSVKVHSFEGRDFELLVRSYGSDGKILLFGNSVNRAISKCDRDTRTIADLVTKNTDISVSNLSRGGLTLGEMMYLAELAVEGGAQPSTIVFPVSPESGFFSTSKSARGFGAFARANLPWLGRVEVNSLPVAYNGLRYGTYSEFSGTYFVREKRSSGCPEERAADVEFVRFMYWRNFLQSVDALDGIEEFVSHARRLEKRGIRVVVWFTPVNMGDLRILHGTDAVNTVYTRIAAVRAELQARGYSYIDTSNLVAASGFADRWCACGHLSEQGRNAAARELIKRLHQLRMTAELGITDPAQVQVPQNH